jgi:cell division protein FtsI (penicillin-binding protein 3)
MAPVPRPRTRSCNDRIAGFLAVSIGLAGVLWLRCVGLQVFEARRYRAVGRSQHMLTERLLAQRGAIVDRAGRPLAQSVRVPSVFANARQVGDKQDLAVQLARLVDQDPAAVQRQLERDKGFVWIARQVDPQLSPQLATLRRAGVGTREELKRIYPQGMFASHLLGFVGVDHQGLEGLELTFNGILGGQDGWRGTLRDAKGDPILGPWTRETPPVAGYDVVLTLDSVVQQVAEDALDWGVRKHHAKGGSVLVLDPASGAVLAMANRPSYDPNRPGRVSADRRRNRTVTDQFEPGSIFKVVTAAALLEEGRVSPEETFFCEQGAWPTVAGHVLHDHHGHGTLSFENIIALSSNIGTAKAAQRLTPDELYRYIRAFGFGRRTGMDVPGEVNGQVPPTRNWWKVSMYNIPIGHGVAVTPAQLAVMTAAVANGGLRVRPYVIDRIQDAEGRVLRAEPRPEPERILSPETAATLQRILTTAIESGTGQPAKIKGLTVAGKTGTAQKIEPSGRYSHSRYVASFVGFGPVPDSRFVIVVNVDEPRGTYFGGTVAAPVFKRIIESLRSYWGLERHAVVAQL